MAKFWRSGMIDKKVIAKREQEEHINKLQRTILELSREEPDVSDLINGIDYDEVRVGDNVVLDFYKPRFYYKTIDDENPTKTTIREMYKWYLKHRKEYNTMDWEKTLNDIRESRGFKLREVENENNTRTLRQEE